MHIFFQEYNYVDDYDKGDNGVYAEEIMRKRRNKVT
jgi:1,4-alpha-glucan branching enzyme